MWAFPAAVLILAITPCFCGRLQGFEVVLNKTDESNLYWDVNYNTLEVRFEVHLRLNYTDWFAIGFSDYGKIQHSDLCVVWTDWKQVTHITDTWTDEHGIVHEDLRQDCKNFKWERIGTMFKFMFTRHFDTCDEEDYVIDTGTTHVVWGRGSGPLFYLAGLSLQSAASTGFLRVQLLRPLIPTVPHPPDTWQLEITNHNVEVPADETTYWCRVVKLPEKLKKKQHIIEYEPVIQKGSEHLVHHMEVFHCNAPHDEVMPSYSGPCRSPQRPAATEVCKKVLAAWAMGAQSFSYPQEAGSPIGGDDFNPYVVLEVHYHNMEHLKDIVDSSGIRLHITPTLRKFDSGIMELGLEYTDKMAIPPRQKNFHLTGFCIMECTAVGLPEEGIVVFGSQLHTHLTGLKVFTKHIRGNIELPELNRDNHFNQHFQQIRRLNRNVHIRPGDELITTCEYNTLARANTTFGGEAITDEMCVNYVHYFPRVDLEVCKSSISHKALTDYFSFMASWEAQNTKGDKGIREKYSAIEWTPLRVHNLQEMYDFGKLSMQCNRSSGERFPGVWENVENSKIVLPMPPYPRFCPF